MTTQREQTIPEIEWCLALAASVNSGCFNFKDILPEEIQRLGRALIRSENEKQTMRKSLEGILCACAHVHDGKEEFPCFKCLLVNHVNKALAGSTPTPCTACAEKDQVAVEFNILAHQWMNAHDALQAGKKYDFPAPVKVPALMASLAEKQGEIERLESVCNEINGWLGMAEHSLRDLMGNTNVAVMKEKLTASLSGSPADQTAKEKV